MTKSEPSLEATDRGLVSIPYDMWDPIKDTLKTQLKAETQDAYSSSSFDVWHDTGSSVLIPRGVADRNELPYSPRPWASRPSPTFTKSLRPNQVVPTAEVISTLIAFSGVTLQAKCGTGKTVMALKVLSETAPKLTVVLVDQTDIADQWLVQVTELLPELRAVILKEDALVLKDWSQTHDVLIVVAQSLMRKTWRDTPLRCDLLIVDEAHVFSAPCFSASICNLNFAKSLALSATPDRKDGLQWVFQDILGTETVVAEAQALTSKVFKFNLSLVPVNMNDYRMAWCRSIRGMTYKARCESCPYFDRFPLACGGNLPTNFGSVVWGDKLNVVAMQTRVAMDPAYLSWTHQTIQYLLEKDRNILVFSNFRGHLEALYSMGVKSFGVEKCGLFVGKGGKSSEKNRTTAMKKQVTYCTFGVANKALDVPHKDTAFFTTQVSDVRQAKGRIERVVPGKKEPWIIDVVHTNIPIFKAMANKRQRIYSDSKCPTQSTTPQLPRSLR